MAVVVGYVATPEGRAALSRAAQECTARSTGLVVVNAHHAGGDLDEHELELTSAVLQEALSALDGAGLSHEVREPVGGDLAEDLLSVAQDVDADLIVIGLRRRSPVGKLILGSNAQRVLLDAHCPVLAVKAAP